MSTVTYWLYFIFHPVRRSSCSMQSFNKKKQCQINKLYGPRQANLVLIAYASSKGSGEPEHPRSLARTFAARSYKQWVKRNLQTENQIPGPSEWLGMRSWNLSWRNARRHKFAWRGSYFPLKVNMSIVCAHTVNATSFFRAGFYVTSSNVTRER